MNRRSLLKKFRNGKDIGSYARVNFEIVGHTGLGEEKISFESDIHYIDIGEGKPVLLLHGIGQSLYTWRNNIDHLVKSGFRVIAPDLAGFGYSSHPNIYFTAEENAIIIKAFMDSINIKRADIVAFSTGCLSAVCLAAAHPKRAGRLVLVSPGAPNEKYPLALKLAATWLGGKLIGLWFSEITMRGILQRMFFDATQITRDVLEGYFEPYRQKDVRETLSKSMRHTDDVYARSVLKSVKSETLIFSGVSDKLHDIETIRYYASCIPDCRHLRIRNCAHLLHEEKHKKFNEETAKFLVKAEEQHTAVRSRRYQRELVDY